MASSSSSFLPPFPFLFLLFILLNVHADPTNILIDGNFDKAFYDSGEAQPFVEVPNSSPESAAVIPGWIVIDGGVQILSNNAYKSSNEASKFSLHLNSHHGPGSLLSLPLLHPRPGATYNVSWTVAAHPDGGPAWRSMNVSLLTDVHPQFTFGPITFGNDTATKGSLTWAPQTFSFVATGDPTTLQFLSSTPGNYGLVIDDVTVFLLNLLENGNFDLGAFKISELEKGEFIIIQAPSSDLWNWFVSSGSIKYARGRYKSSIADEFPAVVDLNGESPGSMTTAIITNESSMYTVLFDYGTNPEADPPVVGSLQVIIQDGDDGRVLQQQEVNLIGASNQSMTKIQWRTCAVSFIAGGSISNLTFVSQVSGMYGPLIDNVQVFQLNADFAKASAFQKSQRNHASLVYASPVLWIMSLSWIVLWSFPL